MVIAFPLAKYVLKKLMRRYTNALEEMSTEVTVSSVEICASLYQSMIRQTTPSTFALCVIMAVDLVQAEVTIKYFLGRRMKTPHNQVFRLAADILERVAEGDTGQDNANRADSLDLDILPSRLKASKVVVVEEALELATAVDSVLLIEYFEVSVPIINVLFLLVTYATSAPRYSLHLYQFYDNAALVLSSTKSVVMYSMLQALSLVAMHMVLRRRHATSAAWHLAFGICVGVPRAVDPGQAHHVHPARLLLDIDPLRCVKSEDADIFHGFGS